MMAHWIWLLSGGLITLLAVKTGFRLLYSLAAGLVAASIVAFFGIPWWGQWGILAGGFTLGEAGRHWVRARFRHIDEHAETRWIIGYRGKIQDVIDQSRSLFLLHCQGRDWVAVPDAPADVSLGDRVEVVGVRGKQVLVRRIGND